MAEDKGEEPEKIKDKIKRLEPIDPKLLIVADQLPVKPRLVNGFVFSAGRLKAIVDLLDSHMTIESDGRTLKIYTEPASFFSAVLAPIDDMTELPTGTWRNMPIQNLKRLLAMLPSDQLRREEAEAQIEQEKKLHKPAKQAPEVPDVAISFNDTALVFTLSFGRFTSDEISLKLPVMPSITE